MYVLLEKQNRGAGGAHKALRIKQATVTNRKTLTTGGGASEVGDGEGGDVDGRREAGAGAGPSGGGATNGDDCDDDDDSDEDAGVRVGRVVAVERGDDGGAEDIGSTPRLKMAGVVAEGSAGGGLLVARAKAGARAKGGLVRAGRGVEGEDTDWRGGVRSSRGVERPGGASKKKTKVGLRGRWHLCWL